jgi:hypothetical protein
MEKTLDIERLRQYLDWLKGEDGVVPPSQAIDVMARVLAPLLAAEGLELFAPETPGLGVDLCAATPSGDSGYKVSLAIEYKHHGGGNPLDVDDVTRFSDHMGKTPYNRAMLIGRFGFTDAAREAARRLEPVFLELLDLGGIGAWVTRHETGKPANAAQMQLMIQSFSHELAQRVAANPEFLDELEWRDLERMMARVMEGIRRQLPTPVHGAVRSGHLR